MRVLRDLDHKTDFVEVVSREFLFKTVTYVKHNITTDTENFKAVVKLLDNLVYRDFFDLD